MRVKIKHQMSLCKYMGHFIRKIEDEFGNVLVFIDHPSGDYENAPAYMEEHDTTYASIADAKRVIRGEEPLYSTLGCDYQKYINRFK